MRKGLLPPPPTAEMYFFLKPKFIRISEYIFKNAQTCNGLMLGEGSLKRNGAWLNQVKMPQELEVIRKSATYR